MAEKLKTAKKKQATANALVQYAVKGIEEKKGSDIVCINLKKIPNSACDYFLICEGNSRTQVQAIAGSVQERVEQNTGSRPWHVEGLQNAEWVLMDYVDVAVHIFQPEARSYYDLENMWADAEVKKMNGANSPPPSPEERRKRKISRIKKKRTIKVKRKTVKRKIKRKK